MIEPDNFILRWVRLKSQANFQPEADDSSSGRGPPKETVSVLPEVAATQQLADAAAEGPFDASALPSIEAITANTDIREFLHSRVPLELSRAALRQVWRTDPAIRDFIGIAEHQWDFNDPNAILGFGPLGATGNNPAMLAQVVDELERVPDQFLESASAELPTLSSTQLAPSSTTVPTYPAVHEAAQQKLAESSLGNTDSSYLPNEERGTSAKTESVAARENHGCLRNHRHHGSAMPH